MNTQMVSTGYYFPPVIQMYTGYIFHILEHFTTKPYNFTKFRMLFQDVVIFLPVSNSFKISSKRLKVHWYTRSTIIVRGVDWVDCCELSKNLLSNFEKTLKHTIL